MASLKDTYSFVIELNSPQTVSFQIAELSEGPNFQIDWGDGTIDNYNANSPVYSSNSKFTLYGIKAEHSYSEAGMYEVQVQAGPLGEISRIGAPTTDENILKKVTSWGPISWKSFNRAFGLDVEEVATVSIESYPDETPIFEECETMTDSFGRINDRVTDPPFDVNIKIPENIGDWDVSGVKSFNSTFANNQESIPPITEWDTSSAESTRLMFLRTSFNQDVSTKQVTKNGTTYIAWDVSNVIKMDRMFEGAQNFNQDIGNWDTSSLQDLAVAFLNTSFNQDISTKTVTVAGNTYTAWDTSRVEDLGLTFQDTPFNQDIGNWDTSSVTNMFETFRGNSAFNQDLSTKTVTVNGDTYVAWDVYNVTDMTRTFANASSFDQNLGNWDVSSLTDAPGMFDGSGMSDENAAKTISGWVNPDYNVAQNDVSDLQSGVTLGLGSNDYTNFSNFGTGNASLGTFVSGQEAIDQLRNNKNWTINIQNG